MKQDVLKFIKEEKEISLYKISLLEKGDKRNYKTRLIACERDFSNFSFELLDLKDIKDARDAITLFKVDRDAFDKKYLYTAASQSNKQSSALKDIELKISFYESIFERIIEQELRQIKLDDSALLADYYNSGKQRDSSSIPKVEGFRLAKKRARTQVLCYCIARFINHKIKIIKEELKAEEPKYDNINETLNSLMKDCRVNMFGYYNSGIEEVPKLVSGTIGDNPMLPAVYPLVNILDNEPEDLSVKMVLSDPEDLDSISATSASRKFVERAFSVVTGINRVGNEWMNSLYIELITHSNSNISSMLMPDFYNIRIGENYYKAVATIPLWNLGDIKISNALFNDCLKLLNINRPDTDYINTNKYNVLDILKRNNCGSISISNKSSRILVAATRSESSHIEDALVLAELLISQIISIFNKKFPQ